MTKEEIKILTERIISGIATDEEILVFDRMFNSLQTSDNAWDEDVLGRKDEIEASLKKDILNRTGKPVVQMKWYRWMAAAVMIFMALGTLAYFAFFNHPATQIAKGTTQHNTLKNEVLPASDKAVLTLADGSTIVLDDAKDGDLTRQGNTRVIELGGKLAYDPTSTGNKEVLYNTIATPNGGQYQVELPDGSLVWLNAASSIRFPTEFIGSQRKVEITGEAYFEIAKNKNMPFIVGVSGAEIQVVGTYFNVMAYGEENLIKTTLLEGAVRFVTGNNTTTLKPGQQSQLTKDGQVHVVNDVDVEEIVAWKNGLFQFNNTDIGSVMRQISRWYDVDVNFKGNQTDNLLYAKIPRNSKLSDVLKVLELTGNIKFEVEGKKITVTNK